MLQTAEAKRLSKCGPKQHLIDVYIYPHGWLISMVNVGKNTTDPLGMDLLQFQQQGGSSEFLTCSFSSPRVIGNLASKNDFECPEDITSPPSQKKGSLTTSGGFSTPPPPNATNPQENSGLIQGSSRVHQVVNYPIIKALGLGGIGGEYPLRFWCRPFSPI